MHARLSDSLHFGPEIGHGMTRPESARHADYWRYANSIWRVPLKRKVEKRFPQNDLKMSKDVQGNYIRTHRRRCHLSQRDLGVLVGYGSKDRGSAVGRHERSNSAPPLLIALAYEIVFKVPVAQIFTGFHAAVGQLVARNLDELKADWRNRGETQRILSAK